MKKVLSFVALVAVGAIVAQSIAGELKEADVEKIVSDVSKIVK